MARKCIQTTTNLLATHENSYLNSAYIIYKVVTSSVKPCTLVLAWPVRKALLRPYKYSGWCHDVISRNWMIYHRLIGVNSYFIS